MALEHGGTATASARQPVPHSRVHRTATKTMTTQSHLFHHDLKSTVNCEKHRAVAIHKPESVSAKISHSSRPAGKKKQQRELTRRYSDHSGFGSHVLQGLHEVVNNA